MKKVISNPYKNVDWGRYERHKSSLHNHSIVIYAEDDVPHATSWPDEILQSYRDNGFSIVSITEHNAVVWPLTEWCLWENLTPEKEHTALFNINGKRLLAVQGNEMMSASWLDVPGAAGRDTCCHFTDVERGEKSDAEILQEIREKGGTCHFAHPDAYCTPDDFEWYAQWFVSFPDVAKGIEVYNGFGERTLNSKILWDNLLTHLMPEYTVWGFSVSDMHDLGHHLRQWNEHLMPELSEENFKQSLHEGSFFACWMKNNNAVAPSVKKITVTDKEIKLDADYYTEIRWISEGKIVEYGDKLSLDNAMLGNYVRVNMRNNYGYTEVQPFGLRYEDEKDIIINKSKLTGKCFPNIIPII